MTNPSDAPQPQPGSQPPANNIPASDFEQPPGYQQPGYQQPGYQPPQEYAPPGAYQGGGQPGYGAPLGGPNNAPPAGLGYAAPARNTFGLDFNNIGQRLTDTRGVPQQLVISYWLWVAAAALGVVASLVSMVSSSAVGGLGLIFSLIFAALYIFIAIRLKEGARWARLVLSILGGLSVAALPFQLMAGGLGLLGSAATIAAAIMMWMPQARDHFRG
jgi:hypothetical protein